MRKMIFLLIAICTLLALTTSWTYKKLCESELSIKQNWMELQLCYEYKANLFPALISFTQNMEREKNGKYFITLAKLRNQYIKATTLNKYRTLDSNFNDLIISLKKDYPQIQSESIFLDFNTKCSSIDVDLTTYSAAYEDSVTDYNELLNSFPLKTIAPIFKLKELDLFDSNLNSALPLSYLVQKEYFTSLKRIEQAQYKWSIVE